MNKIDLLQGTLDLLVLRVLSRGEMHGWGIADRLSQISQHALQLGEGTLYPALYRMEAKGWIKSEWAQSDNNRKAKYYSLTKPGRKQLEAEQENWQRLSGVINAVLESS
jgi:PadR family transcriptional regulator, regulatory protein PadR